jgi:hypothetical protein
VFASVSVVYNREKYKPVGGSKPSVALKVCGIPVSPETFVQLPNETLYKTDI